MRVLHVTAYFAPAFVYGGPPRNVLGLCHGLQSCGVDVEVVTTVANGDRDLPPSAGAGDVFEGVPVHYAPRAFPRRFFGAAVRAPIREALGRADLCHIHGLWNVPAWEASRAARRVGVPVVVSPRGMLQPAALAHGAWRKHVAFALVERPRLARAARVHATTRDEASSLRHIVDPERVIVIPNGVSQPPPVDDGFVRARYGIPAEAPFVVFV